MDWKGEAEYLEARGVDYKAQLPGNEDPVRWYDRFPSLAAARDAEAEERAPVEMTIALDNWRWMPVRQASRLTERQDKEEVDDMRFLARTQFGKGCCYFPARRRSRSSLLRRTRRSGSQKKESAGDQRRQRRCWSKKRKRMRGGWSAKHKISAGRPRCNAEELRIGEGRRPGGQGPGDRVAGNWRRPGPSWSA
jgi:hypothetical protein